MSLSSEEIRQLGEALDKGEPDSWIFDEDGLRVFGRPRRLEIIPMKHGPSLTLVLEVNDRERRVICTTVLESKLQRLDIKPGEPIAIERAAEKTYPTGGGQPYWDFLVKRLEDAQPQELNWGARHALPQETVDAEVIEDHYEVPHLPRDAGGF